MHRSLTPRFVYGRLVPLLGLTFGLLSASLGHNSAPARVVLTALIVSASFGWMLPRFVGDCAGRDRDRHDPLRTGGGDNPDATGPQDSLPGDRGQARMHAL